MRRIALALACSTMLSGCGWFLDLDPPDQPGVAMDSGLGDGGAGGMDAGADAGRDGGTDAGPEAECATLSDCDDGQFCNGMERCERGRCVPGAPVDCMDEVRCTNDRCDEASSRCVHEPDPSRCAPPAVSCLSAFCDPVLDCTVVTNDEGCDDSIDCTIDRCTAAGCEYIPADSECDRGSYCDPSLGDGVGCRRTPDFCLTDSDCPAVRCNLPPRCDETTGECIYTPIESDPTCTDTDRCTPTYCSGGVCVSGARVSCDTTINAASCTVQTCERSARGDTVSCVYVPRPGACSPTMPCHTGSCMGTNCLETNACPPASDACAVAVCSGGGCDSVPVACGANSTCVPDVSAATYTCECDAGWMECGPGASGCACPVLPDAGLPDAGNALPDAGTPLRDASLVCAMGLDCDGDGTCECDPARSLCRGGSCDCLTDCGATRACCRTGGIGFCTRPDLCPPPGG